MSYTVLKCKKLYRIDPLLNDFCVFGCRFNQRIFLAYEVSGYPTFKYFKYFDKERKSYDGGRTKDDFISFMKDPENPLSGKLPPVPTPEEAWADHEG